MSRVRRTVRWSVVGLLALAGLWGAYKSTLRLAEAGTRVGASRQILTVLTLAIVVLALGFVGILVRNLVRLIVDRKRGILGARLRTKLVFFFLALVLLPAFVLSFGAAAFIKQTVEGLLRTPVEEVTRQAKDLIKVVGRQEEARLLQHAALLGSDLTALPASAGDDERRVTLIRWRQRESFDVVGFVDPGGRALVATRGEGGGPPIDAGIARDAVARAGAEARRSGTPVFDQAPMGEAVLLLGAAPVGAGPGAGASAVVGHVVTRDTAELLGRIDAADLAYAEFRAERREKLYLYYSIIALIGLAIVFVASWIGFYVSRRITVPLEQVAAASREISAGNLGVRVQASMGDEVGMLVDAFNEMAGELQESREVITRNTAELRRSNQALEERRRYVETLVEHLGTAVISVDRDGRTTTANPAVRSILGVTLAPGDDTRRALASAGLQPLAALLDASAGARAAGGRRELVLDRDGARLSVSVHLSPLKGSQGDDLGTLVMVEDLTDLLEAQRAAAWREVARRIAHEIKNPLTPIQLAAQRLRKKQAEGAPDLGSVIADSTATIEREVAGLKGLVDEFSLYARMPSPVPQPVAFAEIVESVVALYRVHPEIGWDVKVAPELGVVHVDPEQMRRALINLIDNAIAAMGGVGPITVVARPGAGPGSLRLEVSDRGPGVAEGARDQIFAPYYSTKSRGTGLGLAIVQRVVVEHRGTIHVEDNPGGGARFVVEIPGEGETSATVAGIRATTGGTDAA